MASDVQILISAQDKATDTLNRVVNRLDEMAGRMGNLSSASSAMAASVEKSTNAISSFGSRLGSFGEFLKNSIYFTAMGAAIGGVTTAVNEAANAFVGWNSMMEQSTMSFTTMLGSAEAAETLIDQMKDFAAVTPFQYKDLDVAAKRMLAFGWAAKDILPDLRAIGDASAALGVGGEGINRIILQLGELSNKSKIDGSDIKQLETNGVPALKYLGEAFNFTQAQMDRMADTGVTGMQAVRALIDGMATDQRFKGMMEAQSHTMVGVWSTVKDTLSEVFGKIGESFSNSLKSALDTTGNTLQAFILSMRNKGIIGAINDVFGDAWGSAAARAYNAMSMFWDKLKTLFSSIGTLLNDAFGGAGNFDSFVVGFARIAGAATALLTIVVNVGDAFVKFGRSIADFIAQSTTLSAIVVGLTSAIIGYNVYTGVASAVTATWATVMGIVGPAIFVVKAAIQDYGIVQGIAQAATIGLSLATGTLGARALLVAGTVGVLGAALYEFSQGNKGLAATIVGVGTAFAIYTNRALIAATATALVSGVTAAYEAVVVGIRAAIEIAAATIALYNIAMADYNIVTVAAAAYTAIVNGVIAVCQGTVALATTAWVAIRDAVLGFNIAQALAAVVTAVTDGIIAACTGTVALAEAAWIAVTTALEGFSIAAALSSAAGSVLAAVIAVLESPITLAVAAIVALIAVGYELYDNWDMLSQAAVDIWNSISTSISSIMASLGNWFQTYLPGVYSLVTGTFTSIANAVGEIWTAMVNTVSSLFSTLFNWIASKMGPVGTMLKDLATSVGSGLSSAFDSLTQGVSNQVETVVKQKPNFDLGSLPNQRYEPEPGDSGKSKKEHTGKSPYETQYDKMTELLAKLDEKIQDAVGTTPSIALAKLNKEIVKAQNDINDAMAAGVDTSAVQKALDEYQKVQTKKINDDLLRVQQQFSAETVSIEANTSKDKIKIAQATYDATMAKLSEEMEKWRKAGNDQTEIDRRVAAYKAQAQQKLSDDTEAGLEHLYSLNVQHVDNLYKLDKISASQKDKLSLEYYEKEAARLDALLAKSDLLPENRADLEKQRASVQTNIDDVAQRTPGQKSVQEAIKQIKNMSTNYSQIITSTWDSLSNSVNNFFTDTLIKGKGLGDSLKSLFSNVAQQISNMFLQTILQMTVMNPLKSWFTNLVGGSALNGHLAEGGSAFGGNSYVVGEHGPELFTPNTNGVISSTGSFRQGNSPIIFQISTPDANSFRRSQSQIYADANRAMAAGRRNL